MHKKKVLLMSMNNIPVPGVKIIEGSGLRWWRLAKGLSLNKNIDVTIGLWKDCNQSITTEADKRDSISVIHWGFSEDDDIKIIRTFDTVILPMSMSGHNTRIISYMTSKQQIIVDAYAPFYVESLTRSGSPEDDKQIDSWYEGMLNAGNNALVNADFILYASENQKYFYEGLLSGLGSMTADRVEENRFIMVPGVVEDGKVPPHRKTTKGLTILWFGALYPWYDIRPLIDCFTEPEVANNAKLLIVGGKNPLYSDDNLRYNGQHRSIVEYTKQKEIYGKSVIFKDWVSYADRLSVFSEADIAISLNRDTIENKYSWRIRVSDLAGHGVPIVTNGGDPLGEMLISKGCAFRTEVDTQSIKKTLEDLIQNPTKISIARKKLELHRTELTMPRYSATLAKYIELGNKPRLKHKIKSILLNESELLKDRLDYLTRENRELSTNIIELNDTISNFPKSLRDHVKHSIKYRLGRHDR